MREDESFCLILLLLLRMQIMHIQQIIPKFQRLYIKVIFCCRTSYFNEIIKACHFNQQPNTLQFQHNQNQSESICWLLLVLGQDNNFYLKYNSYFTVMITEIPFYQ